MCVCCLGVVHAPVQSTCRTLPPFPHALVFSVGHHLLRLGTRTIINYAYLDCLQCSLMYTLLLLFVENIEDYVTELDWSSSVT